MSKQPLKAKSVIVTGGGRGLGRAMTLALLDAGARVTAAARSTDQLQSLSDAAQTLPGSLQIITADIRQAGDCAKIVAAANEAFGAVHVLINYAGLTILISTRIGICARIRRNSGRYRTKPWKT